MCTSLAWKALTLMTLIEEYQALSQSWRTAIEAKCSLDQLKKIDLFVNQQREIAQIFPPNGQVFTALRLCPLKHARVVILGQDPYHGAGQAHGLSFSVDAQVQKRPPSLRNIYKELVNDLAVDTPKHGDLTHWAEQGVLLLNTVLTVREAEAHSHRQQGWELLSDAVIQAVSEYAAHAVFILWGKPAQKKAALIAERHTLIESAHPSPLSASRGFFGSQPFSRCNEALQHHQQIPISW